ncbi:MAG: M48 family peptidase [Actinobacteria bacterium]|nr:MAG: M48 family peptidase [Actinomycetota bacterium]
MSYHYSIRESRRAKHVRFRLSPHEGLIVTIPVGFDVDEIPALIERKRRWLERTTAEIEAQRELLNRDPPGRVPESICLRGIAAEWAVECRNGRPGGGPDFKGQDGLKAQQGPDEGKAGREAVAIREAAGRLLLTGPTEDFVLCRAALRRWLVRKGHEHLVPWLRQLAEEHRFDLGRVSIGSQRTRWGSCSRRGTISLNSKLLFVPEELAEYVLVHELCHTRELNHSLRFWRLVESLDADFDRKDKLLKKAWRYVPGWFACG